MFIIERNNPIENFSFQRFTLQFNAKYLAGLNGVLKCFEIINISEKITLFRTR